MSTGAPPWGWHGFLPRMPRLPWEGWFVIGIGGAGDAVRWTKTTVFRSRGRYPLAAVEGLTAPGLVETLAGFTGRIATAVTPFAPDALTAAGDAFAIELPGTLTLGGADATARLERRTDDPRLEAIIRIDTADRLDWARLPGLLRYFGVHGALDGTLTLDGTAHALSGLGAVEHAYGAALPFNPVRAVPGRWHWDVLRFDAAPGGPPPSAAALWVPLPGAGPFGVRGFARLPGEPFGPARPAGLVYEESEEQEARRRPLRWRARLEHGTGTFEYEARAHTPLAPAAPGGGFFGFRFEGRDTPRKGPPRDLQGTGFTECGGRL